ncbi:MAG: redoxin family protein [Clostridia bacterium]|nr:redoxin family protein [Clostridia bacterium]
MKNRLLVLILTLIVSLFIVGCEYIPHKSTDGNNGDEIADQEQNPTQNSDKSDPQNEEDAKEDQEDNPKSDGKKDETEDSIPENNENPDKNENTETPSDDNPTDDPTEPLPEIGTEVGDRFNDITLVTMAGGSISTADLRGKIVIINSWASWCPPCKEELPDFSRIATEYKDQVVIIAADIDAGYGNAKAYVDQNFPETDIVFAYDTVYSDAYNAAGGNGFVPYTAIIDQSGVIIYSDSGMLSYSTLVYLIESALNK